MKQRGGGEQANAINCREDFPANHHQRPAFPADTMAAMKPELALLGGSLRVPSVQELAKEPLTSIPERYVREGQDPPLTASHDTASPMEIPVIDMQRLLVSSDSTESLPELHKFHYACKDWGFFQLINHGVSSSTLKKVKQAIEELFRLPREEKEKLWQEPGDLQGFGQAFVVSEEQKLDWGDLFYMVTLPPHLRKPQLYSKLPQSFRETMTDYCGELKHLAMKILNQMAKALKMEAKDMNELFDEGKQSVRINYYPPCPQPELVMGLTAHSDATGLTILLQVNEIEGLQIKKDGMWVPVKPLPDAFVVNVGDVLEIVTNGIYRSIEHRAAVNSSKERLSVAAFYNAKLDGDLGPAPSLVTPKTPARFMRIGVADYLRGLFSRELQGKSYLDVMRIGND